MLSKIMTGYQILSDQMLSCGMINSQNFFFWFYINATLKFQYTISILCHFQIQLKLEINQIIVSQALNLHVAALWLISCNIRIKTVSTVMRQSEFKVPTMHCFFVYFDPLYTKSMDINSEIWGGGGY